MRRVLYCPTCARNMNVHLRNHMWICRRCKTEFTKQGEVINAAQEGIEPESRQPQHSQVEEGGATTEASGGDSSGQGGEVEEEEA